MEKEDISEYTISGHAIKRYMSRCLPNRTLAESLELMRRSLKSVRRIEKYIYKKNKNRVAYMDDYGIVYIVDNTTIVTVYPKSMKYNPTRNKILRKGDL